MGEKAAGEAEATPSSLAEVLSATSLSPETKPEASPDAARAAATPPSPSSSDSEDEEPRSGKAKKKVRPVRTSVARRLVFTLPQKKKKPASPSSADGVLFAAGLAQIKSGELWASLKGSGLTDAGVRVVCDALVTSSTTSLDLSFNELSDAGASCLAAALGGGSGAELIALNVTGNPALTDTGRAALQSLQRVRKGLAVEGAVLPAPAAPSPPAKAAAQPAGSPGKPAAKTLFSMASRYFGGGGNAPTPPGPPSSVDSSPFGVEEEQRVAPLEAAQMAVSAASAAVAAAAAGEAEKLHPPSLGIALLAACQAIDEELQSDAADAAGGSVGVVQPHLTYARLSDLPPATLTLAQAAEVVATVLQLAPPPLPWQGGSKELVDGARELRPGVGTHRVAALQLCTRLLSLRCAELDALLASCRVVPQAIDIMFGHPCSSAAQVAVSELLQEALRSPHKPLWLPLFHTAPTFQARLAQVGVAAQAQRPGRRPPHVGACMAFANGIRSLELGEAVEGGGGGELRAALSGDAGWQAFCGSALTALNQEQEGTLCAPRPNRPAPMFSGAGRTMSGGEGQGGKPAGSSMGFSPRELLSMLRFLPS